MNRVDVGACVRVPKKLVEEDVIRRELTVTNGRYWAAVESGVSPGALEPEIELFEESRTSFLLPRHYAIPWLNGKRRLVIRHPRPKARPELLSFNQTCQMKPRNQTQIDAIEALKVRGDKIVSLACGGGKTACALEAAAEVGGYPLLIVVPSTELLDQWRKEVMKFHPGIEEEEIGHVQASVERWKGYAITIAMLHTLARREYTPKFWGYFRVIVFDEVHHLAADYFRKVAPKFPGERYGLSATVRRSDGMDLIFRQHLGKVRYQNLEQPLKAKITFVQTGVVVNMKRFMGRRGRVNTGRLTTQLSENPYRNAKILKYVEDGARKGRTILVLCERLTQVRDLYERSVIQSKSMLYGEMKKEERVKALKEQVVFATQHLAKEGLNREAFDTLVISQVFGSEARLQQSVGRIERKAEGKKDPRVLVFEDVSKNVPNGGILAGLGRKMRRWFEQKNYAMKQVRG